MFVFNKKIFLMGLAFLSSLVSLISLVKFSSSCVSMNNQVCEVRPEIINVNSNEPIFYPFSIKTRKD